MTILDLFDHYTEFDARRKETGSTRFEVTARRTFLADAAGQESKRTHWLAIRKLSEHMQHVLLKSIDPELYRCLNHRSIQPQLYALKWMRCLFSNVLTDVNGGSSNSTDAQDRQQHRPGAATPGKKLFSCFTIHIFL